MVQRRPIRLRRLLRASVLGLAAAALVALPAMPTLAQTGSRATVTVAATLTLEAGAQSPLAIRVGPAGALPRNSFVRIRGLPPLAALSEGHSIAPGSWAVPLSSLATLKITLPPDAAGKAEVSVVLVAIDGSVLAEGKSTLVIAAPANVPAGATILRAGTELPADQRGSLGAGGAQTARPMTPEDRERAKRLMQKGEDQLAEGNVAPARLLFEKAADAGLAEAAMALAATFDQSELARLGVRGIQPDAALARRWYERARELGAADAAQRLRRLGSN